MRITNRRIAALTLLGSLATLPIPCANWVASARTLKHKVTTAQLPLSFEVNRGQVAADVKFVARGNGYALLLTSRGEPVLALNGRQHQTASHTDGWQEASRALQPSNPDEGAMLRLEFSGSNAAPSVQGEQRTSGYSNYLLGNNPNKWIIGVPNYERVRYREVFPGVDVIYYTKNRQLEYDFIVRPGTNPDSIRMKIRGANQMNHTELGSLEIRTAGGIVLLHKPVAYQQGPNGEQVVKCNYVVKNGEIRFAFGGYDHSKVLRIDPVLSYAARLDATLYAIAVDGSGNTYVAGSTQATNFPTTAGAFQITSGGAGDALIAKLDPTGSTLLFATHVGGDKYDSLNSIVLDSSGNIIAVGSTASSNFPVNRAFQSSLLGGQDAVLIKLNSSGTQLLYSTYLGGLGSESGQGVAVDANDQVLLTGYTSSDNFPTSAGAAQAVYGGGNADAFVAKLDTTQSGSASRLFSTYLGGSGEDAARALAVHPAGFVFVTGMTRSTNFPTANPFQAACASCATEDDAFVSKLSADGTTLVYSTFLGGEGRDVGNGIAVDSAGNAHIAGETQSRNFPITAGAFGTSYHWLVDGFVAKLNAAGSALVYSSFIGGTEYDLVAGIALDASGNAVVSGNSYSADFPSVNPLQGNVGGLCDDGWGGTYPCSNAFVSQINTSGSALIFSTHLGGESDDSASRVAVDSTGNIYLVGTAGDAFISTPDALQMSGAAFIAKISPASVGAETTTITLTSSPNPSDESQTVTLTATVAPPEVTGTVSFFEGSAAIGSTKIGAGGIAALAKTSLSRGNHSFTAKYWGDTKFASSTSPALAHVVNRIALTAAQTSAIVDNGGTATFALTVDQAGPFTSPIAFSCSGLPAGWNCGFSPTTVPAGSGPTQVTVSVQTSSTTALNFHRPPVGPPGLPVNILSAVLVVLILAILLNSRVRNAPYLRPVVALGLAALFLLAAGCGSSTHETQQETPQVVKVSFSVNATSGGLAASIPLSITVRKN